jgi:hypothetical protein
MWKYLTVGGFVLQQVYAMLSRGVNRVKINAENVENRHLFDGGFRGNRDTVSMGY